MVRELVDRVLWSGSRVLDPLGDVGSAGGLSCNLVAKGVLAGILTHHLVVRNIGA